MLPLMRSKYSTSLVSRQSSLWRNLSLILCVYWVSFGLAGAQGTSTSSRPTIRQIVFVGNEALSRQELEDPLGIRPGDPYDEAQLNRRIEGLLEAYRQRGYAFVTITPQILQLGRGQVQIILVIAEGQPVRLGEYRIQGASRLSPDQIRQELGLKPGTLFDGKRLSEGIARLLRWYSELGHPRAEIRLREIRYDANRGEVSFTLVVNEGPEVHIAGIEVEGLRKTQPQVVLREIPLRVGQVYDQRQIDAAVRRLERLGYFYRIDPIVLAPTERDDAILFRPRVMEARTGRLSGVLGYAPREEKGAPRLTGTLDFEEINLFGTGRKLAISWRSGLVTRYEFSYEEPWLLGRRVHLGLAFSGMRQQDPWTDERSGEDKGTFRLRMGLTEFSETQVSVATARLQVPGMPTRQRKYSLALGWTHDTRDSLLNPRSGHVLHGTVERATGDLQLTRGWADVEWFWQTWEGQVVSLGLHAGRVWGREIPPTELFYLGGAKTLRGYLEDWFRGPARVVANLEYRLLVGRSSQFFFFLDAGSVSSLDHPARMGRVYLGYGFGMRLESKAGTISVQYGIPQNAGALEGKIHVSITPLF